MEGGTKQTLDATVGTALDRAHGRAEQHQVLDLRGFGIVWNFVPDQRVGKRLKLFEIQSLVEFPSRGGRGLVQPEAKGACPVIRRFQKVIQFPQLRFAGVLLDDSAAPVIRSGKAY